MTPTQTLWNHLLNLAKLAQKCQYHHTMMTNALEVNLLLVDLNRLEAGIREAYDLLDQVPKGSIGTPQHTLVIVTNALQSALMRAFGNAQREQEINDVIRVLAEIAQLVWQEPDPEPEEYAHSVLSLQLVMRGDKWSHVEVIAGYTRTARYLAELTPRTLQKAVEEGLEMIKGMALGDVMTEIDFEDVTEQLIAQQEPATPAE
jgi:hypothetical protein